MCEAKPALRCPDHAFSDYYKARTSLTQAKSNPNTTQRDRAKKEATYRKRQGQLNLALHPVSEKQKAEDTYRNLAGRGDLTPKEQKRLILAGYTLNLHAKWQEEDESETLERADRYEHAKYLSNYFRSVRTKKDTTSLPTLPPTPESIIKMFALITSASPSDNGRELTEQEAEWVALAEQGIHPYAAQDENEKSADSVDVDEDLFAPPSLPALPPQLPQLPPPPPRDGTQPSNDGSAGTGEDTQQEPPVLTMEELKRLHGG